MFLYKGKTLEELNEDAQSDGRCEVPAEKLFARSGRDLQPSSR